MRAPFAWRSTRVQIGTIAVASLSLAINVLQGTRILSLEAALQSTRPSQGVLEGSVMPPLVLSDVESRNVTIEYGLDARQTLLYVFSETCIWCQRNRKVFASLVEQIKHDMRIIPLALGREHPPRNSELPTAVYAPSDSTVAAYQLGETPTTVLLSSTGKVVKRWRGVYSGSTKADIEKHLHVVLP